MFFNKTAWKGGLSAIDQGVISFANFLATIMLARFVSPTELGIYAIGFLAIYFVRAVQDGIIIQPLNTIGAVKGLDEFRPYVSTTAIFQLGLAGVSAGMAALSGWILTVLGNDMAGPTLFALWFAFLGWQLQEFIRRVFYTRGVVHRAVINTVLYSTIRLLIIWGMGMRQRLSGVAGLNAIAWGSMAAFLTGCWMARSYWTKNILNLGTTWKQNWRFGRWILGATLANWISRQCYPILAVGMINFAAAGIYQALQNLVAPVHVLLRASDTFLTPRIAKIYHQGRKQNIHWLLGLTYLLVGVPVLGLLGVSVIFSEPLLHFIRGDTYMAYSQGVMLMALFYGLWYAYWPLQTTFKAMRLSWPIFLANVLAIASMFTVGVWAIQNWGVYGAMAGQSINALIVNIVLWVSWLKIAPRKRQSEE